VSEDQLGPHLKDRLRAELERVQPLNSPPRYLAAQTRPITLRLAPAMLGVSVVAILALSAFVATGSPNPAVWGHDVVTIIQSSSTTPTPTATPTQKPQPTPTHKDESAEPTEQPEPSEPGEHHESPEPSDDHSGEGSGSGGGDSHDGGTSDSGDTERS